MEHRTRRSLGRRARRDLAALAVALAVLVGLAGEGPAQSGGTGHGHDPTVSEPKAAEPGRRVTSEELHRLGGVPRGWRFSLPAGDPARGRGVFAGLECYKCHALEGETFPAVSRGDTDVGPELTGMGQLMAFIADRETNEAVPYLGVTAILHASTRPPRSLGLAPSLGERGFHYGASVTLPARTEKITLAIGPTTMQVLPAAGSRYKSPVSVTFEWDDR